MKFLIIIAMLVGCVSVEQRCRESYIDQVSVRHCMRQHQANQAEFVGSLSNSARAAGSITVRPDSGYQPARRMFPEQERCRTRPDYLGRGTVTECERSPW